MGALADDAARLLTELRIPRAHVYGVSMGGMVAQELALRHPARVRGLVLGGTTPGGPFAPRLGPADVLAIARGGHGGARPARAAAVLARSSAASSPSACASCVRHFKRAPQLGRRDRRPDAGQRALLDRCSRLGAPARADARHARRARPPRPARRPRSCWRRASPTRSSPSCPAPGTPTPLKPRRSRSSCCSTGASAGCPDPVRERKHMWRLTDEERELREHIRGVVLEQIRPRVREMDENCDYPHDIHETLASEGLMGLALPSEYGGRDVDRGVVVRLRRGAGEDLRHGLADGGVREARRAADPDRRQRGAEAASACRRS